MTRTYVLYTVRRCETLTLLIKIPDRKDQRMPRQTVKISAVVTVPTEEGETDLKLTKAQAMATLLALANFLGLKIQAPKAQEDPEAYAEGDPDGQPG